MPVHDPIIVDAAQFMRFSESNTAFNALSRDLGEPWPRRFEQRRRDLVARGLAALKTPLADPNDSLAQYALSEAFDRVNVLTAAWGSGKSNRNALLWSAPPALDPALLARKSADPERLGRAVRWAGQRLGAHLVGYAALDERWLYAEVHRNHCAPDAPETQPIRVTDTPHPRESAAGLEIPASMNRVVAIAVPMDRDLIATAPSLLAEAATSLGYSRAAQVSLSLAELIRQLGYDAIPSLNGTGLSIPLAVQAGLGECARNGLLVTPGLGACVRLAKVITDMPLPIAAPLDLGVERYCETCRACADACPAQAIAHGEPTLTGNNECNVNGVMKWHVDAKKCLRYWTASGTSCSACIAACPFTLGAGWWSGLPQRLIRHTGAFNRPLVWLDRRLAARKRRSADEFLC